MEESSRRLIAFAVIGRLDLLRLLFDF